jgi:hypothetical protein
MTRRPGWWLMSQSDANPSQRNSFANCHSDTAQSRGVGAAQDTIAILRALRQEAEATGNHYKALCAAAQLSAALIAADEGTEACTCFILSYASLHRPDSIRQFWTRGRRSARCCCASKTMYGALELTAISRPILATNGRLGRTLPT